MTTDTVVFDINVDSALHATVACLRWLPGLDAVPQTGLSIKCIKWIKLVSNHSRVPTQHLMSFKSSLSAQSALSADFFTQLCIIIDLKGIPNSSTEMSLGRSKHIFNTQKSF